MWCCFRSCGRLGRCFEADVIHGRCSGTSCSSLHSSRRLPPINRQRNAATAITRSKLCAVVSIALSSTVMPAQFTRPSNASSSASASSMAAGSPTSSISGSQPVSSARRASSFALRAAATTLAWLAHNSSTLARPIPLEAPVTRIERSEKSKVVFMSVASVLIGPSLTQQDAPPRYPRASAKAARLTALRPRHRRP